MWVWICFFLFVYYVCFANWLTHESKTRKAFSLYFIALLQSRGIWLFILKMGCILHDLQQQNIYKQWLINHILRLFLLAFCSFLLFKNNYLLSKCTFLLIHLRSDNKLWNCINIFYNHWPQTLVVWHVYILCNFRVGFLSVVWWQNY